MSIKIKIDREKGTVTWTSSDGEEVVARVREMSQGVRDRAMFDGVRIRGERAGAMGCDYWDGKDKGKRYARDGEKMARIRRVVEHLNDPGTGWDWDLSRAKEGGDVLAGKGEEELKRLIERAKEKLGELGIKAGEG